MCILNISFLWQFNSRGFEKMCITWNKAVRKMYSLPYHTHRWILGPLTNQRHIKYQLFARDIKLLHSIKCQISNSIVRECLSCAIYGKQSDYIHVLLYYIEIIHVSEITCKIPIT